MDKPHVAKERLTQITDGAEVSELLARRGNLGVPHTFSRRVGSKIEVYANADELRAWRSQHTSGAEQT
jgi:hypothetical protein